MNAQSPNLDALAENEAFNLHEVRIAQSNNNQSTSRSNESSTVTESESNELSLEELAKVDHRGCLPLHKLLEITSSMEDALMMMEKYPAALQHQNKHGDLPLHIECLYQCRSAVIAKFIELYPEALAKSDLWDNLPLHLVLGNKLADIDIALVMIEKYPAALEHRNRHGELPLHVVCDRYQCRSSIISKCIEIYPEALSVPDAPGYLPLHLLLRNSMSSLDDALTMIEKYPAALQHRSIHDSLPLHVESEYRCRSSIISKCIELYLDSLDNKAIMMIMSKANHDNFYSYAPVLTVIFTHRPMSLYDCRGTYSFKDIRRDHLYRRRILHLLPHHVSTPTHQSDYRDLNWQPRAAMMMLLSQIDQGRQQQESNEALILVDSLLTRAS
jgi:hypothetical protein